MRWPAWILPAGLAAALLLGLSAEARAATITVTGTVNETVASVTVNGIAATVTGTTFSAAGVPLALGPNTITAIATDTAGNAASASITVQLGAKVNVQGTVDASVTTVTVNGVTATLSSGTFSAMVPMMLGVNTVTANAQDGAGNASSTTSRVFIARPPVNHP
jgi:hypothetical protein